MSLQNSIDNLSPKIISSIAETKLRTEQPIIVLEIPSLRANLKATIIINKRAKTKIFSEIIKATINVALKVFKKDSINPVVVEVHTDLKRTVSQTILANSITLTPGTLSVDLDPENQIIKVAIIAPRDTKDIIPFEPYIKQMLE